VANLIGRDILKFFLKIYLNKLIDFSDQKLKEVRFHETLATHRNILKIIHAWEERERLYIQTELCESK
jgi:hypothetical protein